MKWPLDGLEFYYKDFHITRNEDIWWKSYPLNRKEFDPYLLDVAIRQGAHYRPRTKFISLKHDRNFKVNEVVVKDLDKNRKITIQPRVVIAADGVQSNVLKAIGKTTPQKTAMGYIKSYEYHNLKLENAHYGHIYFGAFAEGAYAYIFPKSETIANIGIATLSPYHLESKFNTFLKIISKQLQGSKKAVDRSGKAPIKNPSKKVVYGTIIFAGDSANQNLKPFVEGIQPGIICGAFAGKAAADYLRTQKKLDATYARLINEKMGKLFLESDAIGSELVSSYEQKNKLRFLQEIAMFSYALNDDDMRKIKKLDEHQAQLFLEEKLRSKI